MTLNATSCGTDRSTEASHIEPIATLQQQNSLQILRFCTAHFYFVRERKLRLELLVVVICQFVAPAKQQKFSASAPFLLFEQRLLFFYPMGGERKKTF